jgi:tetratricopeptide (TPR) repeat protein
MKTQSLKLFKEALSEGRLQDAERVARLSHGESPDEWNPIYCLGLVCREKGEYQGALSRYHEALQLVPKQSSESAAILRACGIAHQLLGEYDKAISSFGDSLRIDPESIEGLNSLSITYRKMEKYQHALYYYCIAVNLCFKAASKEVRGDGLIREIHDSNAKKGLLLDGGSFEAYRNAVLSSPYIKLIENIGAAFEAMGDTERAQYFFRTAESKSPVDEDVIWEIFKNAKKDVEIAPKSNHGADARGQ